MPLKASRTKVVRFVETLNAHLDTSDGERVGRRLVLSPRKVDATNEVVRSILETMAPGVMYSISFSKDKTIVYLDNADLIPSVFNSIQEEMRIFKVPGFVEVMSYDLDPLKEMFKENVKFSGGPIAAPTRSYSNKPNGTIGSFVSLRDSESNEMLLGYLTAYHVCDSDAVRSMGTVHAHPNPLLDLAVVKLDPAWLENGLCVNTVHFPAWSDIHDVLQREENEVDSARESQGSQESIFSSSCVDEEWGERVSLLQRATCCSYLLDVCLQIYKIGATTGFTTGTFYELRTTLKHKVHPKYIVKWDTNSKFADNGDCGSVYFKKKNGLHIPMAVHVESGKTKETHLFLQASP